jgi:hypothetical protein
VPKVGLLDSIFLVADFDWSANRRLRKYFRLQLYGIGTNGCGRVGWSSSVICFYRAIHDAKAEVRRLAAGALAGNSAQMLGGSPPLTHHQQVTDGPSQLPASEPETGSTATSTPRSHPPSPYNTRPYLFGTFIPFPFIPAATGCSSIYRFAILLTDGFLRHICPASPVPSASPLRRHTPRKSRCSTRNNHISHRQTT